MEDEENTTPQKRQQISRDNEQTHKDRLHITKAELDSRLTELIQGSFYLLIPQDMAKRTLSCVSMAPIQEILDWFIQNCELGNTLDNEENRQEVIVTNLRQRLCKETLIVMCESQEAGARWCKFQMIPPLECERQMKNRL